MTGSLIAPRQLRRLGFLGYANQPWWEATGWGHKVPGVAITGGYDLDAETASRTAFKVGTQVFNTVEELVKANDIIMIATPPGTHLDAAKQCVAALRPRRRLVLLVQKPATASIADLLELAALETPLVQIRVTHDRRWSVNRWITNQIEDGQIGTPESAIVRFVVPHCTDKLPGWFLDPKLAGGGAGMDLLPHPFDIAWRALGRPEILGVRDASALRLDLPSDCPLEDTLRGTAIFRRSTGAEGEIRFEASWAADAMDMSYEIKGSDGTARLWAEPTAQDVGFRGHIVGGDSELSPREENQPELWQCRGMQAAAAAVLYEQLVDGEEPTDELVRVVESGVSLRTSLTAYKSAELGRFVELV